MVFTFLSLPRPLSSNQLCFCSVRESHYRASLEINDILYAAVQSGVSQTLHRHIHSVSSSLCSDFGTPQPPLKDTYSRNTWGMDTTCHIGGAERGYLLEGRRAVGREKIKDHLRKNRGCCCQCSSLC